MNESVNFAADDCFLTQLKELKQQQPTADSRRLLIMGTLTGAADAPTPTPSHSHCRGGLREPAGPTDSQSKVFLR